MVSFLSVTLTMSRPSQVLRIYTNGQRANDRFALAQRVGTIVKRNADATKKAAASTARRVQPLAKEAITAVYTIRPNQLNGKFRAVVTPDALRVNASTRRFPLMAFGGKWGGRRTAGATASIRRGVVTTYGGSFIATIQGLRSIRVRTEAGNGRRVARGPVRILRGPSPFQMVTDETTGQGEGIARTLIRTLREYYVAERRRLYEVERRGR